MARARWLGGLLVGSLLLGCGGGSSPTEPERVPGSVAGTWRGEMSGRVGGAAFTCALEIDLDDGENGIFFGDWDAECPGANDSSVLGATSVLGFTLLTALPVINRPAAHSLGACGWRAPVTVQGNELRGDWEPSDNCADASLAGGPLRLRFVG